MTKTMTQNENAEITVRQLMEQLESATPPYVLDIRQPEELDELPAIPAAACIPLMQLMARLNEVPKGRRVVLVCASGARSLMAQKFLAAKGYPCQSLHGGMLAWSQAHQAMP